MGGDLPQSLANGRYELVSVLHDHGLVKQYEAHDKRLGLRRRVLTVLDTEDDAERRARFVRDNEALAKLAHPHIVAVEEARPMQGGAFVVTELPPRGTIETHLLEHGPLPPKRAVEVCIAALRALEAAHEAGVVHGSVSVETLWIDASAQVQLTDFAVVLLTGRPAAAAPEQAGSVGEVRSDIYAVGALLLNLLGGASGRRTPPSDLTGFARQCMAPDPELRFQSASSARAALEGFDLPEDPPGTAELGISAAGPTSLHRPALANQSWDDVDWDAVDPDAKTVLHADGGVLPEGPTQPSREPDGGAEAAAALFGDAAESPVPAAPASAPPSTSRPRAAAGGRSMAVVIGVAVVVVVVLLGALFVATR